MELTDEEKKLIKSYVNNSMRLYAVAKEFYMHRNTVEYRFKKIKNKTGLNPKKFEELAELLQIANKKD